MEVLGLSVWTSAFFQTSYKDKTESLPSFRGNVDLAPPMEAMLYRSVVVVMSSYISSSLVNSLDNIFILFTGI